MFNFKQTLATNNITKGTNTKQYVIVHHTATGEGTINGVLNTLTKGSVSCHFVIDMNGDAYKIGSPDNILWHAGESLWGQLNGMNNYSLGIECVGPKEDGTFTRPQLVTLTRLVEHLMAVFNIPKQNVLRHKDITNANISRSKTLWKKGDRSRKVDIYDSMFPDSDFIKWRSQLAPNQA